MRKISKVEAGLPRLQKKKRVAAYARVSMETERMMHSLSAQVSYYNNLIQKNPDWEFAGVYADNFISGTETSKREEFLRMIEDCEAGKIDIVLTKSISRFARNTVDLLETVRHLKKLGISVRFEKENIDSMSGDGELMLSILASFAQEEIISLSNNVKWTRRNNFKKGKAQARFHVFGYRWDGWQLVIEPEEAEVVRGIYERYLRGDSCNKILEWLDSQEAFTLVCDRSALDRMLTNPLYKGDLVLQKSYVADPLKHYRKLNRGELPTYLIEQNHGAIIDPATFDKVQEMRKSRYGKFYFINNKGEERCFTGKIRCGICGKSYWRMPKKPANGQTYGYWRCSTKYEKASLCPSRAITDPTIYSLFCEIFGTDEFDEELFNEKVRGIVMQEDGSVCFCLQDGTEVVKEWKGNPQERGWIDRKRREANADEKCQGNPGNHQPDDADGD